MGGCVMNTQKYEGTLIQKAEEFEGYFRDRCNSAGLSKLFFDYEETKKLIDDLWKKNKELYFYNKLSDHSQRVLGTIWHVLGRKVFDRLEELSEDKDDLKLSFVHELYILLSSVYLHDIGKAAPQIRLGKEPPLKKMGIDEMVLVEKYHAPDAFRIILYSLATEDIIKFGKEISNKQILPGLLGGSNLPVSLCNSFVYAIAWVCGLHKELTPSAEEKLKTRMRELCMPIGRVCNERDDMRYGEVNDEWGFSELTPPEHVRVDLLADILRLGDCLDVTSKRIDEKKFESLRNILDEQSDSEDKDIEELKEIAFKWYSFKVVKSIRVIESRVEKTGKQGVVVHNIVLEYIVPSKQESNLLYLRNKTEKDFRNLIFLKRIERYSNCKAKKHSVKGYLEDCWWYSNGWASNCCEKCMDRLLLKEYGYNAVPDKIVLEMKYSVEFNEKENFDNVLKDLVKEEKKKRKEELQELSSPSPGDQTFDIVPLYPDPGKLPLEKQMKDYSDFRLYYPYCKEILYVMEIFNRHQDQALSIEEVIRLIGLSEDRKAPRFCLISKICESLTNAFGRDADKKVKPFLLHKDNRYRYNIEMDKESIHFYSDILNTYRSNPYGLKKRIEELTKYKEYLLLEHYSEKEYIKTGIHGLDMVLTPPQKRIKHHIGIKRGRCILIKGEPGTGKTTMAIQILNHHRHLKRSIYFSFDEDKQQLIENFQEFSWNLEVLNVERLFQGPSMLQGGEHSAKDSKWVLFSKIFKRIISSVEDKDPELVVFDITVPFKKLIGEEHARQLFSDFIGILKVRQITSFFIGAESEEDFEIDDYLTDGIIHLVKKENKRQLQVLKLRGQYFSPERHSFEIFDKMQAEKFFSRFKQDSMNPEAGIYVFCDPKIYTENIDFKDVEIVENETPGKTMKVVSTGTYGLDELLPLNPDEKPTLRADNEQFRKKLERKTGLGKIKTHFENIDLEHFENDADFEEEVETYLREEGIEKEQRESLKRQILNCAVQQNSGLIPGTTCLIVGSPGSGKTLSGLQFLRPVDNRVHKDESPSLWLSFEGELSQLKMSTLRFKSQAEKAYNSLIDELNDRDNKSYFFLYEFPGHIDEGKFFYKINYFVRECKVKKIVFDSISDLREKFENKIQFKKFIHSLIYYLNRNGVTTIFLYRLPVFFGDFEILGVEITSMVDSILVLRNFDIHNQIQKGVFVLKMRGREHRSNIRTIKVSPELGLEVKDLGWSFENLLSGKPAEIKEPEIFLKFFYENFGESKVNEATLKEFRGRYNQAHQFCTLVRKDQIHIDHWSFTEKKGPGHSNVKVVSLAKYWAVALHEKGRLQPLLEMIPEEKIKDKLRDTFWKLCLDSTNREGPETAFWPEGPGVERVPEECSTKAQVYLVPYYVDIFCISYNKELISRVLSPLFENEKSFKVELNWENLLKLIANRKELKERINSEKLDKFESFDSLGENVLKKEDLTWEELRLFGKFICSMNNDKDKDEQDKYHWFALPGITDVTSFVPAFMQFVWALEGDLYNLAKIKKQYYPYPEKKGEKDFYGNLKRVITDMKETDKELDDIIIKDPTPIKKALEYIGKWVRENQCGIPNPLDGDFRANAVFAPSWYSRIIEITQDKTNVKDEKINGSESSDHFEKRFEKRVEDFGVMFFPRFKKGDKRIFSAYDVNCVGLIQDTISPETGWLFIDALTSPENVKTLTQYRIGFPANRDLFEEHSTKNIDNDAFELANRIIFEDGALVESKTGSGKNQPRYYRKDLSKLPFFYRIERFVSRELRKILSELKGKNLSDDVIETFAQNVKENIKEVIKEVKPDAH
jgi:KaiC/GvpD/RAD55 family RecA-like ATPase